MSTDSSITSRSKLVGGELERELDRISLEQVLRDFEVANARVTELTQRLINLSHEITSLREQVVSAQEQLADARRVNVEIRSSATFRVAELARKIARRLS